MSSMEIAFHLYENAGVSPILLNQRMKQKVTQKWQSECLWQFQTALSTGCVNASFENLTN